MSAKILDGRALAAAIREKVKGRVASLPQKPGLAVILVGDDPASALYVGLKEKACEEVGIRFEKKLFPASVSEKILIDEIKDLNGRNDVDGILVQLPLPSQDADRVVLAIDPKKDVDGFRPGSFLAPPVHLGVMKLIDAATPNNPSPTASTPNPSLVRRGLAPMNAVIIGSKIFATPLVSLLKERNVAAQIISPDAKDLSSKLHDADIVVTAVGKPSFITGNMLKAGSIVIDVGTSKVNGKVVGDVDRTSVDAVAGFVSPVPGGSGPLTVAYLLLNVLKASLLSS